MSASRSRLEVQLQRQLHQAREVVLAIGEHTENRTGKRGALRSAANRGIGQVEGFGLELETVAFAELGFLGDGRVQLRQGGVLDVAREALRQVALAYTNHTLLPEALEKWSVPLLEKVLPRHMLIVFNINHQFLREMQQYSFLDGEKLRKMSIIEEGYEKQVRMAHLCIVGSHSVNGVSKLHSDLIIHSLVPEFAMIWPNKFNNKTNGVAPRRWLMEANPGLTDLISHTLDERKR